MTDATIAPLTCPLPKGREDENKGTGKMIKYLTIAAMLGVFLCGCGDKPDEPGIVDYISGHEQIKTYQKTKEKIEDINKATRERNAGQ